MSISVAPMQDGGALRQGFGGALHMPEQAAVPVSSVNVSPMKAYDTKISAPIDQLQNQVKTAKADLHGAIAGALDARKKLDRQFGMAGVGDAKAANLFNPAKDGMLAATAFAMPVLAPAVSALALASVLGYIKADRKGGANKKQLQARFEDQFRSTGMCGGGFAGRDIFDVNWANTGYRAAAIPNADDGQDVSKIFDAVHRPLEQDYGFQIVLGQRAHIHGVQAANENRADKGVPLSLQSIDKAEQIDAKRLNDFNAVHRNLPGQYL